MATSSPLPELSIFQIAIEFAYLDTQAQLGTILELVEPPAGLGEPLRRI